MPRSWPYAIRGSGPLAQAGRRKHSAQPAAGKGWVFYLVRRAGAAVLLVLVVSSTALVLGRLAPGDLTTELVGTGVSQETLALQRAQYGLDRPLIEEYLAWVSRAVRLDLGVSFRYGRSVSALVGERALNTGVLALAALVLATGLGVPLGVYTGSRPGLVSSLIAGGSFISLSLPPLLTSLVLAFLAARSGWFPVGGMQSFGALELGWSERIADLAWHLLLPVLALALPVVAVLERLQSQAMSEALEQPCMRAALARGVSARRVIWAHALRLAIRPVAAVFGIVLGSLLSGSFVVEIVMAWPGLGRLMYDAIEARDLYLVAGCAGAGAAFLAVGSLISDLILAAVDPRIREHAS